jgi:hypothetical protein
MLISSNGNILASSDPADANRLNQALDINGLKEAQNGVEVQRINYIPNLHSQAIDIFSPVIGSNHQVIGIIRLTYPYENIYVEFTQTRFLIIDSTAKTTGRISSDLHPPQKARFLI